MADDTETVEEPVPFRPKRRPPPGRQKITRKKYEAILEAFRKYGKNYKAVAEDCGVSRSTAAIAYEKGWAHQKNKEWALPVRDVLKAEKIEARAALAREKKALVQDHRIARQDQLRQAIEDGFADLVDSRSKQGKVIRAARDNSIAALVVSQKLLKASIPLADKIAEELETGNHDVFQRMRLMRQLGRFTHDAIEMAQVVEEMERRALGEPDKIMELNGNLNMTVDEAKETLGELAEVLEIYKEGDIEDVIDAEWAPSEKFQEESDRNGGESVKEDSGEPPTADAESPSTGHVEAEEGDT